VGKKKHEIARQAEKIKEENNMNPEKNMNTLDQAITEYGFELKLAGKSEKCVMALKRFKDYINESNMNFLYMKIKDAMDFQTYLTVKTTAKGKNLSSHYILFVISRTCSFYEFLRKKGFVYSNPFSEIKRMKQKKLLPRNILSEENMDMFLKHFRNFLAGNDLAEKKTFYQIHVIGELMYSTGARINEVAKLKPEDIDFYRGVVKIEDSKSGKMRDVILNSYAEKVLRIYVDMRKYALSDRIDREKNLLFGTVQNIKTKLNRVLQAESKKLNLGRFTSHGFRHALGYHLLRGGADIRFIQEILGHRSLNTTQIYTKVDKEDLKNVIDEFHPRKIRI